MYNNDYLDANISTTKIFSCQKRKVTKIWVNYREKVLHHFPKNISSHFITILKESSVRAAYWNRQNKMTKLFSNEQQEDAF